MSRTIDIDAWGLGPKVAELWARGLRARAVANHITPDVEAACRKIRQEAPNIEALTAKVERYMKQGLGDKRTKKARNQAKVAELEVEAAGQILQAQVDAAETLQRYVQRLDAEVTRLESVMERDEETGAIVAPGFAKYYAALTSLSKEVRGWITLLVDIKDRMWQHEQYERAMATILAVIRDECPTDIMERIVRRLKDNEMILAVISGQQVGG